MYEADVFYMSIMYIREWREERQKQEQRVNQFNVVRQWGAWDRGRDFYDLPILGVTKAT